MTIHPSFDEISRLPSLEALGVTEEILSAVEELFADADGPGVERHTIEAALRFAVHYATKIRPAPPASEPA